MEMDDSTSDTEWQADTRSFADTKYVHSVGTVVVEMGGESKGYIKIVLN